MQGRGVEIVAVGFHCKPGDFPDLYTLQHPNQAQYAGRRILVVTLDDDGSRIPRGCRKYD